MNSVERKRIRHPLFSGRKERERIITWLRRRSQSEESLRIANEIEACVDVEETQDLRDPTDYPTDGDAASAIGGWSTYVSLTDEESATLQRIATRLAELQRTAQAKNTDEATHK